MIGRYRGVALWGSKKRKQRPTKLDQPADRMEVVRRSSSLPSGVFKALDNDIEEKLKGPVADVFLQHMMAPSIGAAVSDSEPDEVVENRVDPAEIAKFFETYADKAAAETPRLDAGESSERIWVLADLATNGSGRARELATRELRHVISRFDRTDEFEPELLMAFVEAITDEQASGNISVVLEMLLTSANRTLSKIQASSDD